MKKQYIMTLLLILNLAGFIMATGISTIEVQAAEQKKSGLPAEIKIGGVFPIVKRPDAGRDRRDAFLMAIDEINNQTGTNRILPEGVKLVPIVKDDDNSAAGGTAAAKALIAEGVQIVIGSSGSSVSAAMATELGSQKIPQISYAASSPSLSDRSLYPYFMRVVGSDADQGKAIADLVQVFGWKRGATIHTSDSYGAGMTSVFIDIFKKRGGSIVTDQQFDPGATDVSAQVQTIVDANPEFVLGHFIDVDAATAVKKAWELGAIKRNWITTDGWSTTATFSNNEIVKKAMQKMIGTTPAPLTGDSYKVFNQSWFDPKWKFLEGPAYGQSSGKMFNAYAPYSYDAVFVAAKGLAVANTTDGETLLKTLYKIKHDGASGSIEFNNLGEIIGRYDYVQLDGDTYKTFGKWKNDTTLDDGKITLPDNSVWTIANNKVSPSDKIKETITETAEEKTPIPIETKPTPGFIGIEVLSLIAVMIAIRKRKMHE